MFMVELRTAEKQKTKKMEKGQPGHPSGVIRALPSSVLN
jgi:hypothetical protein